MTASAAGAIPGDIERHRFDLIVVGGGINGTAIARDAAMRGLDVLLLERHDIGWATTAASTRLIHGGLRYLEHCELGLVRESLRERETLLRIAPHLVRPLPLLLPIYDHDRRGPATIRLGMLAYDLFSRDKSLPRHQMVGPERAARLAPGLERAGLRAAALYYDAQVESPERLALAQALDARAHGATILTHTEARRIIVRHGRVAGANVKCARTGAEFSAHARIVVNAAGPWVDAALGTLGRRPLVGGTKGSHVVVERPDGFGARAVYAEARSDRRPFFVIPWRDMVLIGTTDTRYAGDPAQAQVTRDEADYLLRETRRLFPDQPLDLDDVRVTWAGVRPLPAARGGATAAITRRHVIHRHRSEARGLYSVIGGKLTTCRSLAEEVTDRVRREIGHGDPCDTANRPLPGAGSLEPVRRRAAKLGVPDVAFERLARLYGSRADALLDVVERNPDLARPLGDAPDALAAEVVFAFETEFAATIADTLIRRTLLALRPGLGAGVVESAIAVAATRFGWDSQRIARERREFETEIARFAPPA